MLPNHLTPEETNLYNSSDDQTKKLITKLADERTKAIVLTEQLATEAQMHQALLEEYGKLREAALNALGSFNGYMRPSSNPARIADRQRNKDFTVVKRLKDLLK